MKDLPAIFNKFKTSVIHILGITILFILFILIYKPTDLVSLMEGNKLSYSFNFSIVISIIFISLLILRLSYYFVAKHATKMTYFRYLFWCLGELAIICCFLALYFRLLTEDGVYFDILGHSAIKFISVLILPYLVIFLCIHLNVYSTSEEIPTQSRIRFYDDKHILKFITSADSILYIEADENYVTIVHKEGEKLKEFTLRSSMKNLEAVCHKNKLLRCHRSYYVNVTHIKTLHKAKDGIIYAELDCNEAKSIPVTQRYYLQISDAL